MNWIGVLLMYAAVDAAALHAQRNSVEPVVRGLVVDDRSGEPVAFANVELLDEEDRALVSAIADGQGRFLLRRMRPGSFRLRVARIGYSRTITPASTVRSGETVDVEVRLSRAALVLAPLKITARSVAPSPILSAFEQRVKRRMGGFFITPEEIRRRRPARVTDLLETVPGLTVQSAMGMATSRLVINGRALPGISRSGNGCPIQIYIDGVLATRMHQHVSPDDLVAAESLEGIEIFRGLSSVPPEFMSAEARCGVLAIWTRRGAG